MLVRMQDPPPSENVSWSVVARAAAGEPEARSIFGRSYLPVVRSFLAARWRAVPLESEVDDAVQEVLMECLRRGGVLTRADASQGDLRGLLFGVTRNVAARFEERARSRNRLGAEAGSVIERIEAREASLSVLFDREWAQTLMRLAGERMRVQAGAGDAEARRRVELLELRFSEGLPTRAIAERWSLEPEVVQRAYARAREEFGRCLRAVVSEHATRTEAELDAEVEQLFGLLG